jgi:hypothetical protein
LWLKAATAPASDSLRGAVGRRNFYAGDKFARLRIDCNDIGKRATDIDAEPEFASACHERRPRNRR